jgi:hypothetical protein
MTRAKFLDDIWFSQEDWAGTGSGLLNLQNYEVSF